MTNREFDKYPIYHPFEYNGVIYSMSMPLGPDGMPLFYDLKGKAIYPNDGLKEIPTIEDLKLLITYSCYNVKINDSGNLEDIGFGFEIVGTELMCNPLHEIGGSVESYYDAIELMRSVRRMVAAWLQYKDQLEAVQ